MPWILWRLPWHLQFIWFTQGLATWKTRSMKPTFDSHNHLPATHSFSFHVQFCFFVLFMAFFLSYWPLHCLSTVYIWLSFNFFCFQTLWSYIDFWRSAGAYNRDILVDISLHKCRCREIWRHVSQFVLIVFVSLYLCMCVKGRDNRLLLYTFVVLLILELILLLCVVPRNFGCARWFGNKVEGFQADAEA